MNTLFNCSLWGDEAFSAVAAQKAFLPMMQVVLKDTSPPLMYIIMWTWFRLFGSSEISIRSLALLFYLATIFVIYLIGKKLFSTKAGILGALLSFFNPFLFPYAFEGRMYFCLLFFITLSFYFLITKNKLGYVLSAAAALYSHHFGVLAIFAQFVWQLTQIKKFDSKNIKQLVSPYLLVGLAYLPWIYPFYLQTKLVSTGFWLGKPKIKDLLTTFIHFLKHEEVIKAQKVIPYLTGVVLIFRKWQKKDVGKDLLLISWAIIPAATAFLISQTSLSIFYERYLLYSVPPIMILLASKTRKISFPIIGLVLLIFITTCWQYFINPFKRPFREFASWVKENSPKNTFIVNYNGASHHIWESKYYGIEAPIYTPGGELPFFVGTAQMTEKDTISQLPEVKSIALISSESPDSVKVEGYWITGHRRIGPLYFIYIQKEIGF